MKRHAMSALADTMELPADYSNPMPSSRPMKFTHSPNDLVLDRYTIRRGIGVGGFGEVYFAVSQAGKEVALKRIQRNLEVELRGVSHCLNLKHQNLVSLHDVCRDADDQT
ncbi:MAG: serine/threonine protein kinase, partial [Rhodopirellula bahusiensis]